MAEGSNIESSSPLQKEKMKKMSFPQYRQGGEIPGFNQVIEKSGVLSAKSTIKLEGQEGKVQGEPRTLALRRIRRELIGVMKRTPKIDVDKRLAIIEQGHARDQLAEEFMNTQREVRVDMGDLGEQTARFVVLTPPESRKTETSESKSPIFIIPGISNDLESMGMLPQELAFRGRKVVMIGFPESWHGEATDAFGKATEQSKSYEPHTTFFKKAIEAVALDQGVIDRIGTPSEIDLWGYSTGAAIVAEMLTDTKFSENISNAAIICPPSCVDQNNLKLPFGIEAPLPSGVANELREVFRSSKNMRNAAKLNVFNRKEEQYTEDHRRRMLRTYNALREKVLKKNYWWTKDIRPRDGGKITVVSYDNDNMTRSYEAVNEIRQNPNLSVVELHGTHNTALSEPATIIKAIAATEG